jgi:hypothetical protein
MTNENSNTLVDGLIPRGVACPFLDNCGLRGKQCLIKRDIDFSCAAARLFNIKTKSK